LNSRISLAALANQDRLNQLVEELANEKFERFKDQITKGLVYERFENDIRCMAETIAEKGLADFRLKLDEMQATAFYLEQEIKKRDKQTSSLKKENARLYRVKQEVEQDRDKLFEANRKLVKENQELRAQLSSDIDERPPDGESFVSY
jgi:chromosome segregation ATPase